MTATAVAARPRRFSGWKGAQYLLLVFFAAMVLIPLYVLVVTSLKSPVGVSPSDAWNLPRIWSVSGWATAWPQLAPALFRSLVMSVTAAVLSSILGSLNGYVFAKWSFPDRRPCSRCSCSGCSSPTRP